MKKKLLALLLCVGMLAEAAIPLFANDTNEIIVETDSEKTNELVVSTEQETYENEKTLYIEDGNITISVNDNGQTTYSQNDTEGLCNILYLSNRDTATRYNGTILINSVEKFDINIVLQNLSIESDSNAFSVQGDGNVNIELDGDNILKSASPHAGLEIVTTSSIVINDVDNNGSLGAQGSGAGIGSARYANNGKITINGGTIRAIGGFNSAGIGGGDSGSAGLITINGGSITAQCSWYGCGIGSGSYSDEGGRIIINGGSIVANSNVHGAGIGGAESGFVDGIFICGGEISSSGRGWEAGMGDGHGNSKSLVILNGKVTSTGGKYDLGFADGAVRVTSVTGRNEDGTFTAVNHIHTFDTIVSDTPATYDSPRLISFYCLNSECPKYGELIEYPIGEKLEYVTPTPSENDLVGKTFTQSTLRALGYDTIPADYAVSEYPPFLQFTNENSGIFYIVNSEFGYPVNFTYNLAGDLITITPSDTGDYAEGRFGQATELVMQMTEDGNLKVKSYSPEPTDTNNYAIGWTTYDDIFLLKDIPSVKPTVSNMPTDYQITLGESFDLSNVTVTAGNDGRLSKVTLKHNLTGTTFAPISTLVAYQDNSITLGNKFILSGDEYPLNTVGTHEFIIYASADNYTVTDNAVATFTVTIKGKMDVDEPQSLIERIIYMIVCNEHNTDYKYDGSDYYYGSVTINDNGASSIGIFQWREGRTFDLLNAIVNCDLITQEEVKEILGTGKLYDDIVNGDRSAWEKRKLTTEEAEKVKTLLLTSAGINEQDYMAQKNAEEYRADAEDCGITQEAAKIVYADARNIGKGYADEIAKSAIAKVSGNGSKVTWELLLNEYASHEKLGANGYKQRRDRLERLLTEWYGTTTSDKPVEPDAPLEVTVYDSKQNTVNDGDILNGEYTVVISNVPSDYQNCVFINLKSTDDLYTIYAHQIIGDKAFVDFDTTKMQEASYKLSAFAYKFNDDIPKSYGYLNFKTKWEPIYEFEYKGNLIENNSTIPITKNDAANVEFTFISNNRDINGNSLKTEVIQSVCYVDEKPVSNFISPYDAIVNKSSKHVIKNLSDKSHEIRITIDKVGEVIKEYNFTLIVTNAPLIEGNVFQQNDKTQKWYNYGYGKGDNWIDGTNNATIASSGCALLSLTNAVYYLNGKFIDPTLLADFAMETNDPWNYGKKIRENYNGTAHSLFETFAKSDKGKEFNITVSEHYAKTNEKEEDWWNRLIKHLNNGGTSVANRLGHFFAIVDYRIDDDKFLVYDSCVSVNRDVSIYGTWLSKTDLSSKIRNMRCYVLIDKK